MPKLPRVIAQTLPSILILTGTAVFLAALVHWWLAQSIQNNDRLFEIVLRTGKGEDYFNAKLDLLNKRLEDMRTMLGYLLAIAGFVTAAQGLFAYLNVKNYNDQADAAVKKLVEIQKTTEEAERQAQQRLLEIQAKTPVFAQMNKVIDDAVAKLSSLFQDPDSFVDLYDKFDDMDQQKILYYEKSVAGLDSVELAETSVKLEAIYRGLCVFYASRYFSLRKRARVDGTPAPTADDLHRARMYAELARKYNLNVFCIENDLGWIEWKGGNQKESMEHFNRSLALHPEQQRAGNNIGIIFIKEKRYGDAAVEFRKSLTQRYWELSKENLKSRPYYNLACALTKIAETDLANRETLLKEAIGALEEATKYDLTGHKKPFKDDTAPGGDLELLQGTPEYNERMSALAGKFAVTS